MSSALLLKGCLTQTVVGGQMGTNARDEAFIENAQLPISVNLSPRMGSKSIPCIVHAEIEQRGEKRGKGRELDSRPFKALQINTTFWKFYDAGHIG